MLTRDVRSAAMRTEKFRIGGLIEPEPVERLPWPRAARFVLGAAALFWMIIFLIIRTTI